MATTMTVKGQVTIPKNVRDALRLAPGDRFEAARGKAQVKWRTDKLMALLRGSDWITRDARRYRSYFPRVELVSPTSANR
jgi:AbrB family looped-hinge helix DNA binding protein